MILGRKPQAIEKLCGSGGGAPSVEFIELAMQLRDSSTLGRGIVGCSVEFEGSQFTHDRISTSVSP
jgi:hypothetical protein